MNATVLIQNITGTTPITILKGNSIMMNFMTKAYVTAQVKAQTFAQDNRGSIIEYVMIIALAGVFIGLAKPELTTLISETIAAAKKSVTP